MKRLRTDNGIHGGVSKRDAFSGPLPCFHTWVEIDQLCQHCRNRLNGDDGRLGVTQVSQELSCASAEVERDLTFPEGQIVAQPNIHLGWIVWSASCIACCHYGVTVGCRVMDVGHQPNLTMIVDESPGRTFDEHIRSPNLLSIFLRSLP